MDCLNMVRNTLNDFSRPSVKFQSDYSVVKIVDGTRRMRHLFLFDNSLVCAKPGDKLDFMIKWVLSHAGLVGAEVRTAGTDANGC